MRRLSPVLILLAGCSDYSASGDPAPADASSDGFPQTTVPAGPSDTGSPGPPEQEEDLLLLPPAQTDVYVFVANPDRDTVTRVNVRTLDVDTTAVGVRPEIVLTTNDFRQAAVFNRGDESVTVIDAESLTKETVDVRENLNDMVLSPDGDWAVLFHNAARDRADDPVPEGLQSFNEVSFVSLDDAVHTPMAVGFNPKMVRFTPDSSLAVVVSDAYLAKIDLTVTPLVPVLVELESSVVDPPAAEEVIVAADGSFAWVRQFGATDLLVVDLGDGAVDTVEAGTNPTDLDLSPDGLAAVAVARGSAELWVYDAQRPFAPAEVLPLPAEAGYGSLLFDPTGDQAVVFTTAAPVEQFGVWDVTAGSVVERALVKPVASMAITPTGGSLLVFHTLEDGPRTEPVFAGSWALTLIDLADFRPNPLLLPAEPIGYANSTTGELGYFVMDQTPFLEVLDYESLLADEYPLSSIPSYIGVLPDLEPTDGDESPAWVSQEHPLGRISFFDPDDRSLETLTGFELNSGIEDDR